MADMKMLANSTHYRDVRTVGVPETVFKTLPLNMLYQTAGIQTMNFNTNFQLAADRCRIL